MKYYRTRNTSQRRDDKEGMLLSMTINAKSPEEADALFEERWAQKCAARSAAASALAEQGSPLAAANLLPLIDLVAFRAEYLSPEALQWKKEHPGQLRP